MNIKIEKRDLDLIQKASGIIGQDKSDFVRLSVKKELARLGFLTKQESKALGVEIS